MRIDVLTIFPEMFDAVINASIIRRARESGLVDIRIHNIRDFSTSKHMNVDDRPYGGGPGMVFMAEPLARAIKTLLDESEGARTELALLTPAGKKFDQESARYYSGLERLILICGHYEGFDERIRIMFDPSEISIGDYVLTGGELPAMVVMDAVTRLIPGVLGESESVVDESFSKDRLDYPHYTRPVNYEGIEVPEILLSGHHANIRNWRDSRSKEQTIKHRPDLLQKKNEEM